MSNPSPPGEVTRMLQQWSSGDQTVVEQLTPLVYDELRRLAGAYMHRERPGHTLQPTALIHEAFLRLIDQGQPEWRGRAHFFSFAAHLMRQILVDHARAKGAGKRGAGLQKITLSHADAAAPERTIDLVALDEALNRLAAFDERRARVLELRFFGGLTEEETAESLGVSIATVQRALRLAKAWLSREIGEK
jgi:RNA polymerase sigma factor (TIGR02999 family)